MSAKTIVIGGASGFWGEAGHASAQLLGAERIDYLVFDYLAEVTMSIMARARAKDPAMGYATDFVTAAIAPNLEMIAERGVKIISNAGGVNPDACAAAVRELVAKKRLDLKVAVVTGDDLMARAGDFAEAGTTEMFTGEAFPPADKIASINAYLGAFPIAGALGRGADIVITGRCVDSAVTLAACIHAFGWGAEDFDLLAAGALAGHLIECGPQATGGNFTDWRQAGDIAEIGYPLAEVSADGTIDIFKPEGTTGIVSPFSVGEQMLYEIGDPQAYLLPDVTCDFSQVTLEQAGSGRVRVAGAKGRAPTPCYKVSATWADGHRAGQLLFFAGFEAREKAKAFCDAALERARKILRSMNAPDYDEVSFEVLGGAPDGAGFSEGFEEITAKIAVKHMDPRGVGLFLRELVGLALATPAGLSIFAGGGRPRPSPVVRLFSFLVDKSEVAIAIDMGDGPQDFAPPAVTFGEAEPEARAGPPPAPAMDGPMATVPLIMLAVARSGDKGDKANIGVMARRPEYLPFIWAALTPARVAETFGERVKGGIERYPLPGSHSLNLVLDAALGGGGVASLRNDAQGKAYAQRLLAIEVEVLKAIAEKVMGEAA